MVYGMLRKYLLLQSWVFNMNLTLSEVIGGLIGPLLKSEEGGRLGYIYRTWVGILRIYSFFLVLLE